MDQHFTMHPASRTAVELLVLDFAQLTAALAAQQAASATGMAATLIAQPPRAAMTPSQALAILFSGSASWTGAVAALDGRFHPDVHCHAQLGPASAPSGASMPRQQA